MKPKLTYEEALEAQKWKRELLDNCCMGLLWRYEKLWFASSKVIKKHKKKMRKNEKKNNA